MHCSGAQRVFPVGGGGDPEDFPCLERGGGENEMWQSRRFSLSRGGDM